MPPTFVDASALVAILKRESDADVYAARLDAATGDIWTSPLARYEVVTPVAATLAQAGGRAALAPADVAQAEALLDELMARFGIREVPITPAIGRLALDALARFGKLAGHPARLNMGDCFAHACATSLGASLLYKGDDFARTDLA